MDRSFVKPRANLFEFENLFVHQLADMLLPPQCNNGYQSKTMCSLSITAAAAADTDADADTTDTAAHAHDHAHSFTA